MHALNSAKRLLPYIRNIIWLNCHMSSCLLNVRGIINTMFKCKCDKLFHLQQIAVAQSGRELGPQAEGWEFESQS